MKYLIRDLAACLIWLIANYLSVQVITGQNVRIIPLLSLFLLINVVPSLEDQRIPLRRHRTRVDGYEPLILSLISGNASVIWMIGLIPRFFMGSTVVWLLNLAIVIVVEAIAFWNGIIRVYATSVQIGLKRRVIRILCGWLSVLNLLTLWRIIGIVYEEAGSRSHKILHTISLEHEEQCKIRYPLLMVHGVFFRDLKYFNYWGRVPKELEKNGAVIYYGNHQPAASVVDSGVELAARIRQIVEGISCEKANIIAHSKGGLDCRYAISCLGVEELVASLTTINTLYRGCVFADYLLNVTSVALKEKVTDAHNVALKKPGDEKPDSITAVSDLTASACTAFNEKVPDMNGVYYQSVGPKLNRASNGRFSLNLSHQLVRYFDGPNDGLVVESSPPWGENFTFLTTFGKRGISHGDMTDLSRENIREFDVREFYINLVSGLRGKGFQMMDGVVCRGVRKRQAVLSANKIFQIFL